MDGDLTADIELRLEGRVTYLVPFSERHLRDPRYLSWLRDYEVAKTIGRPEFLTEISFKEIEGYFRRISQSENDLFFALHMRQDDVFIGTAKAGHIDRDAGIADIGIIIGSRDRWGQGLATDALQCLCAYMFGARGMRRLTAGAMAVNPAMIRVFEKLGFRREGTLRQHVPFEGGYTDHVLLGCFRDEFVSATSRSAPTG